MAARCLAHLQPILQCFSIYFEATEVLQRLLAVLSACPIGWLQEALRYVQLTKRHRGGTFPPRFLFQLLWSLFRAPEIFTLSDLTNLWDWLRDYLEMLPALPSFLRDSCGIISKMAAEIVRFISVPRKSLQQVKICLTRERKNGRKETNDSRRKLEITWRGPHGISGQLLHSLPLRLQQLATTTWKNKNKKKTNRRSFVSRRWPNRKWRTFRNIRFSNHIRQSSHLNSLRRRRAVSGSGFRSHR